MEPELVKRLIQLNRDFYARFASEFSETRASESVNIAPILPYVSERARILDIGCGNGRIAQRLDREGITLDYVGIDVTQELIEIAEARTAHFKNIRAEFRVADITKREWSETMKSRAPFDLVIMRAVLHHIPSFELRAQVLREIRVLMRENSSLLMSNWQFTRNERLRKKIVEWKVLGFDENELEEGDALFDWKRGGIGYRYCHLLTENEIDSLAKECGFKITEQSYANDGMDLVSILKT